MSPEDLQSLFQKAQQLHQANRLAEAERAYLLLLEEVPANPQLWHLLGVLAYQRGDTAQAIPRYRKAIELRPEFAQAHNNLALAYKAGGNTSAAVQSYTAALAARADYAEAAYNLALLHEEAGDLEQAERAYRRALATRPGWTDLLGNLGNLLRRQHRLGEAEPLLQQAMSIAGDDATSIGNLALLRIDQGRLADGRALAERAASLEPSEARWWEAAGIAARLMGDSDGAVAPLERASALEPQDAATALELGLALEACADDAGARAALSRAREMDPRWERLRWSEALLLPRVPLDDAQIEQALARFDAGLGRLEEGLSLASAQDRRAALEAASSVLPFGLHYFPGDHTARQCRFADLVARVARAAMPEWTAALQLASPTDRRIRVGFVSSYLRNHVVERFFAPFITELDGREFERWVWFTDNNADALTRQIAAKVEHFQPGAFEPAVVAAAIRKADLDVLVYPDIGLDPRQQVLAALRLAPVQAACYGHPVTSGLDSVDHFLSAERFEPPGSREHYREELVRLPGLGARPRPPLAAGDGSWARSLRSGSATLVMCLQNLTKITPDFDAVLADIVSQSQARVVLFERGQRLSERVRRRIEGAFGRRGVDPAALHIEPARAYGEFLGGIVEADLVLDTPVFSGGATSLDALGVGVPVLTFEGSMARGRQTSGMLRLIDLPDLVAADDADYTSRAVALLRDPARLQALRRSIGARAGGLFTDDAPVAAFARFLRASARR